MGKVITVASGKGGTGKTTTVAVVSSCLAAMGHKTLCVDFDAGLRNLDLSLGMADYAVADFMDVLGGDMDLMDACHEHPRIPNLFFLAAPTTIGPAAPEAEGLLPMFERIKAEFEYCFVDSPSGIGAYFRLAHKCADMSIIVTTGELSAVRDAQMAAEAVREMGVGELRLLVNRVLPGNFRLIRTTVDDIIDTVGVRLLGLAREDRCVFLALHENTPLVLYRKRRSAYDFLDAARRITGEDVPTRFRR